MSGPQNFKQMIGVCLLGAGVFFILLLLPFWVWSLLIGLALVVAGICLIKKSC